MAGRLLRRVLAGAVLAHGATADVEVCTDETCGLGDAVPLVQRSAKSPWLDVYMTSVDSIEDLMYWAVMYKSMKPHYHAHTHWLVIRKGGELMKRAHAIRMAIARPFWNARVDVFNPENLNLASVDAKSWRQLAPFAYSPEEYRRVVHMEPDMLVFHNIDTLTHQVPHMILAREQGDCRNLTDALNSERPSTALFSMVPDKEVTNLMTSAVTLLAREAEDPESKHANVTHAHLVSRAFTKIHPDRVQTKFASTEVVSANCLMHHKDSVLKSKSIIESMHVLSLGSEGRKLINDIIYHGDKRLVNTLTSLNNAGKGALANAVKTWFECFASEDVKNIIDAAKNGILAES